MNLINNWDIFYKSIEKPSHKNERYIDLSKGFNTETSVSSLAHYSFLNKEAMSQFNAIVTESPFTQFIKKQNNLKEGWIDFEFELENVINTFSKILNYSSQKVTLYRPKDQLNTYDISV